MAYIELNDKQLLKAVSSSLDEAYDHLLVNGLLKIMIKSLRDWHGLDYVLVEKLSKEAKNYLGEE